MCLSQDGRQRARISSDFYRDRWGTSRRFNPGSFRTKSTKAVSRAWVSDGEGAYPFPRFAWPETKFKTSHKKGGSMKQVARGVVKLWHLWMAVAAVLVLGAGSVVAVQAQINAVYLNANIGTVSNANVVLGYSNDGSGNLTPLPGSPYSTGGTGSAPAAGMSLGLQTDDDQQVIVNKAGSLLFTVNGFSNTIAVFTINSDGSLTPVAGSPSTSGGPQPASLGLFDGILSNGNSFLV